MSNEESKRLQEYRERDYFEYSRGALSWERLAERLKLRAGMTIEKLMEIYEEIKARG